MVELEGWETADQLIDAAWTQGHEVTPAQLIRYQQRGALWPPEQTSRGSGGGRGTVTVYPPGSATQLIALRELLAKDRNLERAIWALWWQGFPIVEDVIRAQLATRLAELIESEKAARRLSDTEWDQSAGDEAWRQLEKALSTRGAAYVKQTLRRLGFDNQADAIRLCLLIVSGALESPEQITTLLPLPELPLPDGDSMSSTDVANAAFGVASATRLPQLAEALGNAKWVDLQAARAELIALSPLLDSYIAPRLANLGPEFVEVTSERAVLNAQFLHKHVFLVWLTHRDNRIAKVLLSMAKFGTVPEVPNGK